MQIVDVVYFREMGGLGSGMKHDDDGSLRPQIREQLVEQSELMHGKVVEEVFQENDLGVF